MAENNETVRLQCINDGYKLRVRIISPNYNNDYNCQFPRSIRVENRLYEVPSTDIILVEKGGQQPFYKVKTKIEDIKTVGE